MLPFQFYYQDRWHQASYVISGTPAHGFFWCFLEDDDLVRSFGHSMIFSYSNGTLLPAKNYDTEHEALVEAIRVAILPIYEQQEAVRNP
jgi:hypothetical protein